MVLLLPIDEWSTLQRRCTAAELIDAHIRVCLSAAYPIWTLRAYRRFLFSGTFLVHVIGRFRPEQSSTSLATAPRCFKRGHGKVGKAVNGRPCEATRFIGQVGSYIPVVYSTNRTFTAGFLKMLSKPAEKCGWAVRPSQGHTLPPSPPSRTKTLYQTCRCYLTLPAADRRLLHTYQSETISLRWNARWVLGVIMRHRTRAGLQLAESHAALKQQQLAKLALIEASHTRVSAEVMSAVSPLPAADRGNFDRACRRPSGQLHASIHGIVFCLPSMGEGYEPTTYRDVG